MDTRFAAWNAALAEAIGAIGAQTAPAALERALRQLLDFDILMIFSYIGAERPSCLYHNLPEERAETVIRAYCAGPYLLDPFYGAASDPAAVGVRQLKAMAPDQFYSSEYYRQHYMRTRIRDEVGFVCRPPGFSAVVLSFTRPQGAPGFTRQDLARVHAVEPVVRRLVEQHFGQTELAARTPALVDPINAALDTMTNGILTPREIEVTSLILRGHSSLSIGQHLAIAEGTVKIHRKNIYQKLKIGSQSELFSRFIVSLARS